MNYKLIIGFLVTLIAFIFLFYGIDFEKFFDALKDANGWFLLLGAIMYLAGFLIRGFRWKILLDNMKQIKFRETVQLTVVGYAVNNVFPARAGEFARAYLAGKRNGISRTSSLATIFVERVFDGLTVVTILVILLFYYPFPVWVRTLSDIAGILFATLFVFIFVSSFSNIPFLILKKVKPWFPDVFSPIFKLGEKFLNGAASLKSIGQLIKIVLLSFSIWAVEITVYFAVVHAFNLDIPLVAFFLMLVAVNLGMLLPSTPGGLGVFQFAVVESLLLFSIQKSSGMAVALVLHMVQIIPVTVIGLLWLYRHHISIENIEKEKRLED